MIIISNGGVIQDCEIVLESGDKIVGLNLRNVLIDDLTNYPFEVMPIFKKCILENTTLASQQRPQANVFHVDFTHKKE